MKRIVEVTCSLKDANEVIEGLVKEEGRDTKDLLVTIPIEIEDKREVYEALVNNPKILQWEVIQPEDISAEQVSPKVEDIPTDEEPREDIGRAIILTRPVDLYKFIYLLSEIFIETPALLPLTKTWETKYYSKLSNLSLKLDENLLNKCQVILDLIVGETIDRTGEIAMIVYNKLRGYQKESSGESEANPGSYCKKAINDLLDDRKNG